MKKSTLKLELGSIKSLDLLMYLSSQFEYTEAYNTECPICNGISRVHFACKDCIYKELLLRGLSADTVNLLYAKHTLTVEALQQRKEVEKLVRKELLDRELTKRKHT